MDQSPYPPFVNVRTAKSGDYTAVGSDNGQCLDFTATATLSLTAAAALGNSWRIWAYNSSTGVVTIAGNGSEKIRTPSGLYGTITLNQGETVLLLCTGTAFEALTRSYYEVHVEDFGAKGDGTSDDTAAIAAAIASVPTANVYPRIVLSPGRRYVIGSATTSGNYALTIDRPLTLQGNNAILSFAGASGACGIQVNAAYVYLDRVRIQKPSYSTTDATLLTGTGIQLLSNATRVAQKCRLHECYVEGFGIGLYLLGSTAGCAYTEIYSPHLKNNAIGFLADATVNASSYCTAGNIYGGEITCILDPGAVMTGTRNVEIRNTNVANHDTAQFNFYGTIVEGTAIERKVKCAGKYNSFIGLDYDSAASSGTDVEFTSISAKNTIIGPIIDVNVVSDSGSDNWVQGNSTGIKVNTQMKVSAGTTYFQDTAFSIHDDGDATKRLNFSIANANASTDVTFNTGAQTASRSVALPVLGADSIFALSAAALTSTRIPVATTNGLLNDFGYFKFVGGTLIIGDGTTAYDPSVNVDKKAGQTASYTIKTGSVLRWSIAGNSTAESGSDAGTDFIINARTDAGASIDIPITIIRAAGGAITIVRPVAQTGSTTFSTGTGAVSLNGHTTIASGKDLILGNTYVNTPQVPTGYIVIKDATGTAYKVPCNL